MIPLRQRCLKVVEIQSGASARAPTPTDTLPRRTGTKKSFSRDYVVKVDGAKFCWSGSEQINSGSGIVAVERSFVEEGSRGCVN